jgi:hypothetical protein
MIHSWISLSLSPFLIALQDYLIETIGLVADILREVERLFKCCCSWWLGVEVLGRLAGGAGGTAVPRLMSARVMFTSF